MAKRIKLDVDLLIKKYKSGMSTRELAVEFEVHPSTIQDRLRKSNEIKSVGRYRIYTDIERKQRRLAYDKIYNISKSGKEAHRRRCLKDRQKVRARWTVKNNIRAGKLPRVKTQSCFDCGGRASEYDHYLGYEEKNMLDIEAVCKKRHIDREKLRGY